METSTFFWMSQIYIDIQILFSLYYHYVFCLWRLGHWFFWWCVFVCLFGSSLATKSRFSSTSVYASFAVLFFLFKWFFKGVHKFHSDKKCNKMCCSAQFENFQTVNRVKSIWSSYLQNNYIGDSVETIHIWDVESWIIKVGKDPCDQVQPLHKAMTFTICLHATSTPFLNISRSMDATTSLYSLFQYLTPFPWRNSS